MITTSSGLIHSLEWIDNIQQKITGDFDAKLSREIATRLSDEGFVYNPELSFDEDEHGRIFEIAAESEAFVKGDFTASLARAIAKELSFEGVYKPRVKAFTVPRA